MLSLILAVGTLTIAGPAAEAPRVFRIGGHSHTCRGNFTREHIWNNLKTWCTENEVDAFGLGSPWQVEDLKLNWHYQGAFRDHYYAGETDPTHPIDLQQPYRMIDEANSLGLKTLFYIDNETPKHRFGHLWHVGFNVLHPSWHDYDQDRRMWYSSFDDNDSVTNSVTGMPDRRRRYREIVDEQRAAGALCIWAHPTSWWTTNGDPNGPFVTNIAAEMIPELLEDGYLDGMTVVGYDAFHRDYQALWFELLDRGYRVPGFAELDLSPGHNITSLGTKLFNILPNDGKTELTLDYIKDNFRKARHSMSSGPIVFLEVDGHEQGDDIKSGQGMAHKITVTAFPAKGEQKLSKVELIGRGGEVLETVRDWNGGKFTWTLNGTDNGGYVVVRCFGENDSDYLYKPQQQVRHCALTNPVWLRTDNFRPPAPIKPKRDHMENEKVRELMDYLARGYFRKDFPGCFPGIVPVKAWRIDDFIKALSE